MATEIEETTTARVNGVRLAYEFHGTGGVPLVMVHGSLLSRRNWDLVVPHLEDSFRVLSYDRRGHGESERPSGQGSVREDIADLAALIEHLELAPAWVAGQSFGGEIALALAGERPDLIRGIIAHEPGPITLVADDPALVPTLEAFARTNAAVTKRIASGDNAGAAKQFIEEALGQGVWARLPRWFQQDTIENVPTYLDEANDPGIEDFDLDRIRGFTRPTLLTIGEESPPAFAPVVDKFAQALPSAEVRHFSGAGHVIQVDKPKDFAEAILDFVRRHTA